MCSDVRSLSELIIEGSFSLVCLCVCVCWGAAWPSLCQPEITVGFSTTHTCGPSEYLHCSSLTDNKHPPAIRRRERRDKHCRIWTMVDSVESGKVLQQKPFPHTRVHVNICMRTFHDKWSNRNRNICRPI